jgi:hypothetical protein
MEQRFLIVLNKCFVNEENKKKTFKNLKCGKFLLEKFV